MYNLVEVIKGFHNVGALDEALLIANYVGQIFDEGSRFLNQTGVKGIDELYSTSHWQWDVVDREFFMAYIEQSLEGDCHCNSGRDYRDCCAIDEIPELVDVIGMTNRTWLVLDAVGKGRGEELSGMIIPEYIDIPKGDTHRNRLPVTRYGGSRPTTFSDELRFLVHDGHITPHEAKAARVIGNCLSRN